ncbi:MAG: aminomethyl-transferring glycine dehydrogenase subunit GcvPB [Exilispira sp.]|jgi:glycine dehydrogenase subunit 2|nr:aminomethyl-transferring glycine dehydrogenase subunit GcvPB [Exilispira sp.]
MTKLLSEISKNQRVGYILPKTDIPQLSIESIYHKNILAESDRQIPELSEVDVIRHFTELSKKNFGVDLGFYPLGSCTMKYNPKINEETAKFDGFLNIHPLQDESTVQGILELQYKLLKSLSEITGMKWGTLQPFAGAHGEFVGMKLFKAYFNAKGEKRTKLLVPDSAHGTNPASAHIAGFEVVEIKSDENGLVSIDEVKKHVGSDLAGLMLTNPNTLGLFEKNIIEIAKIVHDAGGLLYYDGANFNAILGKVRPGDMNFDVVHLNLHKTFSTPHGGGGPGSGPIMVNEKLIPFLPVPDIVFENNSYMLSYNKPQSIGRVSGFYGNIAVMVRAYTYILTMGQKGLNEVSEKAVLNANYLRVKLSKLIKIAYDTICKHEFVLTGKEIKEKYGVSTLDIAKRMLDYGVHPPTIYFPLIVPEALMIEPTETESKETLDYFVSIIESIIKDINENPEILHNAPNNTPIKRLDEVKAAKEPKLKW